MRWTEGKFDSRVRRLRRRTVALSAGVIGTFVLSLLAATPAALAATPVTSVTIAGDFQSEAGCGGDWDPACQPLTIGPDGVVWVGTVDLPAGDYQYKVAINGSWDVNYGAGGQLNGGNMAFHTDGGAVTFYFDPRTDIAQSSAEGPIVTVAGDFQSELGCPADWDPSCLLSVAEDGDRNGVYSTSATLPAGSYGAKVAYNLGWNENYGAGGAAGGTNIPFTVPVAGTVTFTYNATTHILTITTPQAPSPPPAVKTVTVLFPSALIAKAPAVVKANVIVYAVNHTAPVGTITVTDQGIAVASSSMTSGDAGRVTVTLPPLGKGVHVLRANFVGAAGFSDAKTLLPVAVIIR